VLAIVTTGTLTSLGELCVWLFETAAAAVIMIEAESSKEEAAGAAVQMRNRCSRTRKRSDRFRRLGML
jgi:hypothetical protein